MKPSEDFTFKILSDEDFDKLPYDDAKQSLGLSVMATKTAYIRRTGVKELDMGTIQHEFDELMQETSPHEINGIRYKKAGNIFKIILPFALSLIPGIGPILGAATGVGAGLHSLSQSQAAQKKNQEAQAKQFQSLFGAAGPSQATQAFASQSEAPLGLSQFNTSLSNLSKNREATQQSVFSRFRGLGSPEQNTAFSGALGKATKGSDLAKSQFLEDQKTLGSTFV